MNHDVLVFVTTALAFAGQGLDVITTNAGLATGGKELNGFVAGAIKKIGFPAVAFIKVGGLGIGIPVLFYGLGHPNVAAGMASFVAVAGFAAGIINYRREKAAKISVF